MVRAFLAIDLPRELKKELYKLQEISLSEGGKIKWVEEENFHLTICFFGNIAEKTVEKIGKLGEEVVSKFAPFHLELNEIGFFPEKGHPRVVWIGLNSLETNFLNLVESLYKSFRTLKLDISKEKFHPHITLFRIKRIDNLEDIIGYIEKLRENARPLKGKSFLVREIVLFKSELSSLGPKYSPLKILKLGDQK